MVNADAAAAARETHQQIADVLMKVLRARQAEWLVAPHESQEVARQRFMNALFAFNTFVFGGKGTVE